MIFLILGKSGDLIESRRGADPASSYVASLLAKGGDAILKKIGEEATETVMASKDGAPGKGAVRRASSARACPEGRGRCRKE